MMPNAPQCTSYDELTSAAGVQNSPLYNFQNYPYFLILKGHLATFFQHLIE